MFHDRSASDRRLRNVYVKSRVRTPTSLVPVTIPEIPSLACRGIIRRDNGGRNDRRSPLQLIIDVVSQKSYTFPRRL